MTGDPFDPEALVNVTVPLLGLTVTAESCAQTVAHLRIAADHAHKLLSVALDDEEEPAPVFTP